MRPVIHPAATATVALTRRYTKRCGVSITHKAAAASNQHTPTPKHTPRTRHMHCSLRDRAADNEWAPHTSSGGVSPLTPGQGEKKTKHVFTEETKKGKNNDLIPSLC